MYCIIREFLTFKVSYQCKSHAEALSRRPNESCSEDSSSIINSAVFVSKGMLQMSTMSWCDDIFRSSSPSLVPKETLPSKTEWPDTRWKTREVSKWTIIEKKWKLKARTEQNWAELDVWYNSGNHEYSSSLKQSDAHWIKQSSAKFQWSQHKCL